MNAQLNPAPVAVIKPNTQAAQILQALRANPMEPAEMQARWSGYSQAMGLLIRSGYIVLAGTRFHALYRITDAGRAACPSRRA